MIKLVAFDWNGTLLADTICSWEGSSKQLEFCGKKPMSLLKFRQTFAFPYSECLVANGVERKFILKNSRKIAKTFFDFYERRAKKCRTRSGVREVLSWLQKNDIECIIYSNHTLLGIQAQLKRLKIKNYIKTVLAHSDQTNGLHNKNKDQKLLSYIKSNNFKAGEVVSIGDTAEEIEIGKQNGFYTVAITGGYSTVAKLKINHPDFLIHNMKDLTSIITKVNQS